MTINFNQPPYFDDYDEAKKFYKILFRPGYAVQTRELNQLQTLLQKQVSRFGSGVYKEGAMVIPGGLGYKNAFSYVKLTGAMSSLIVSNNTDAETAITSPATIESIIKDCVGKRLVGVITGVQATIKWYRLATENDPLTLYVEYGSSSTKDTPNGIAGTINTFADAEPLNIINNDVISSTNYIGHRVQAISTGATGNGSAVEVSRGVYFVRGNFVFVEPQTMLLDPYGTTPSYRVGFRINESIVTSELDASLSDNANGSFNYSAPGAHRHSIELLLHKLPLVSSDDTNFVELLKTNDGYRESHVVNTSYSELARELARRTYDESGDYTVNGFRMNAKDSRSNNRGEWVAGTAYVSGDVITRTVVTTENNTSVTRVYTYVAVTSGTSGANPPSITTKNLLDGNITWSYEPYPVYNNGQSVDGDATKMTVAIEPGKAYVRGFEVDKPSSAFIEIDKAREYAQVEGDLIPTTIGNYVMVKTVTGIPDFTIFDQVNLYRDTILDNTIVGTARIRGLERFGSTFKLYLMSVEMVSGYSFSRDVKHIGNGTCDCTLDNVNATNLGKGSVTLGAATAGLSSVTGVGTSSFTTTFKPNDYIDIQGNFFKITAVTSSSMTVSNPTGVTGLTGAAYSLFLTVQFDQDKNTSIFPLGKSYIRSVTNQTTGTKRINTSYVIMQKATITLGGSETSKTISLSSIAGPSTGTGSRIDPNTDPIEIIVARSGIGNGFVTPSSITFSSVDDSTFTLNGLTAGATYTVFFPVTKNTPSTARFKTKTLQTYQQKDIITGAGVASRIISIGKADVYKIRQILMAGTTGEITSATELTDVTSYFTLDNGQRDTHYDIASIVRKPSYGAPSGSIRIIYDYFTHSTTGDYFCVDSYTNFTLDNLPSYSSANGNTYSLGDVLDFRPRISDSGLNFIDSNAILAMPPKPGTSTQVDYTYYMPRIDKISLDANGTFIVTKGTSSDMPVAPETPTLTMNMAVVTLTPYTYSAQDVYIKTIDNRRYTMRDIGTLEKRIDNLEYYTSLSLLEQEASSLQIQDELGLNRSKNGFIVDNFTGYTVADATSNEFRASIDASTRELRPSYSMDNANLIEKLSPSTRTGYSVTGDLVTLPYTEDKLISQLYASRPENINPFAIFTFIGRASLNPPSDEWITTSRLPDIVNDVEGNYAAVLANSQSILGAQWGAWETNWTGISRVQQYMNRRANVGHGRAVDTVTSRTGTRSRTGINTTVQATFSKEKVGDKVVSTSVIPWIRSRHVVFLARGLRLNTIVYPFFDKTGISKYVTPASLIEFKGVNPANAEDIGKFDYETNVGSENDEKARRFNGNVQSAYNTGDVVYLKRRGTSTYATADVSICTAVCVLQEVQPGGTSRTARLVNTTGSFQPGDIICGTISGTEAQVVSFELGSKGGALMTNLGGDVAGVFDIPETDTAKFPTGVREFKLIDNLANNDLIAKTRAHGEYRAQGTLHNWQATYNSVRNGEVVRTPMSQGGDIQEEIGRAETGWYDPLAQTFLVQNKGGAFITSVDIWFASVDPLKPVTLQIREVINGYPGRVVLPFSEVVYQPYQLRDENQPEGFGLSSNRVMHEGTQYLAPDKPSKFMMKAPVYVQDMTEYCIVLISNSNNYHVWTSVLGGIDITTSTPRLISEQPYAGVLFKSQNGSTWTAHQNEDLTFRINVAKFDESGYADFNNSRLGTITLDESPFFTRALSKLVRVFHPNHGFTTGEKVTISGVSNVASTNGININDLNKTHNIIWVDQDSYVIRSSTTANRTGRMGGTNILSTYNLKFDTIHPIIQTQNFSDTSLNFGIKPTTSASVSGTQTAGTLANNFYPIIANENNDFYAPQMICSPDNETLYLGGAKSLVVRAEMSTSNPYLSPVIDTSRFSLVTVNNRIDSQTYETANYVAQDGDGEFDLYTLVSNTTISFAGNKIITDNADTKGKFAAQRPGKYIKIIGGVNGDANKVHRIVSIASDGSSITTASTFTTAAVGTAITIQIYDNYIDETVKNGSAISKYLTKRVDLSNASGVSNNINVRFNADIPPAASVELYYKVGLISSVIPFEDVDWKLFATQSITQGPTDVSFDITGLNEFNAAAVKLVMKSTNSAAIPKISDLIVVATA